LLNLSYTSIHASVYMFGRLYNEFIYKELDTS
jgi:hypothetical protein